MLLQIIIMFVIAAYFLTCYNFQFINSGKPKLAYGFNARFQSTGGIEQLSKFLHLSLETLSIESREDNSMLFFEKTQYQWGGVSTPVDCSK